ncbi:MAG TPA: hypothetical protein VIC08_13225 [Cellvibrionaceae bacterium]
MTSSTLTSSSTWQRTFWRGCLAVLLVCGFALKGQAIPAAEEPLHKLSTAESVHWWTTGVHELAPSGTRLTPDAQDGSDLSTALHLPFTLITIAALLLTGWRYDFTYTLPLPRIQASPSAPRAPPL